jgi:pre-60S factor REI1
MATVHSFFIPDVEYLADLPGLLKYLGEKAAVGYACFYCPRSFWSLEAVRGHMRDTSHCKVKYDTDEDQEEFDEFYDFSKAQPGDAAGATEADAPKAEDHVQVSEDGFSLHLNGKSVGHRALRMYYRQAAPRLSRPAPSETARAITQVVGAYRLLGWSGSQSSGAQMSKQARDERKAAHKAASLALAVGVRQNRIQKNHPRDQTTIF